jgi:hypothetical protein
VCVILIASSEAYIRAHKVWPALFSSTKKIEADKTILSEDRLAQKWSRLARHRRGKAQRRRKKKLF